MLEERPSLLNYYAPSLVFRARSRLVMNQGEAQAVLRDIVAVDLSLAAGAEFSVFHNGTIEGRVGGDCLALAETCCLALVVFEPCEKHAQTRKRPPCGTEAVAQNGLERHGEDIEIIVGVIDPVVTIHHVK